MDDEDKTRQELLGELLELRRENAELEIKLLSLTQSEEKFRSMVHTAREEVCVVQDWMLAFVNRSIASFLGYLEDELIGRPFTDSLCPREANSPYKRAISTIGRFLVWVITEEDCQKAVELYEKEQHRISMVILDLMMPKVGGRSCLDALLKSQPNVRVLIASGYSDSDKKDELIQAGAKGFLGKPFEMAHLLKAVRDALAAS